LLKKEGSSVESYYSRIVGKRNYKRVFGPAFNAVISQRADDFPADTLFKKRPRRKDILKSFTFPGGVQTITDTIASQSGIIVLKSKEVREIRYGYNLFALRTADGERFETEALALATPASVSAELLRSAFPALAEKISFIETHPVESAGVALKRGLVSLRPLAGLIPVDDSFHSVVSRDTVKDDQFRGFCFHFKPHRRDNNEKLQRISEVLKVELDQITHIMSKRNIVPSLKGGHDALVNDIDGLLSGKPLFLTGNYFSGLAIEECVTRSLTEYRRMKDTASGSYPCDSI
jgi:protoporphyrinogen oxidase